MFLIFGIDQFAVGLLVPPHEAEIAVHDVGSRMDVADDALAAGDALRGGEHVLDGVARLVLGYGRIAGATEAAMAVPSIRAGVHVRAVIGVDHMAGGAAAGT